MVLRNNKETCKRITITKGCMLVSVAIHDKPSVHQTMQGSLLFVGLSVSRATLTCRSNVDASLHVCAVVSRRCASARDQCIIKIVSTNRERKPYDLSYPHSESNGAESGLGTKMHVYNGDLGSHGDTIHSICNSNALNVRDVVLQRGTYRNRIFVDSRLKQSKTVDSVLRRTSVVVRSPIALQK